MYKRSKWFEGQGGAMCGQIPHPELKTLATPLVFFLCTVFSTHGGAVGFPFYIRDTYYHVRLIWLLLIGQAGMCVLGTPV